MSGTDFDPNDPLAPLRGSASAAEDRFVDQLDARLRVRHAADRRPARQPLWRRMAVLAPAMVVLLVAASVVMVARDQDPSAALVLTDAANVTVHLPDGTSVDDPADGFELVEGATIEIRDGGMATIDNVTVDVAAILVVRDGELVTDVIVTTTTTGRGDSTLDTQTDADALDGSRDEGLGDDGRVEPEIDADPDRSDPLGGDDRPPSTTVTTVRPALDDESDRDPEPSDPPPTLPVDAPAVEIGMRLRAVDEGVHISWFVRGAEDSWSVAVVRRDGDSSGESFSTMSDLLAVDEVTLVADARSANEGQVVDGEPGGDTPVRYRILVVDSGGGIVASSPAQSLRR
jgi:hypothetical protein